MTGRERPGLCDAQTAVALHPPPSRRWLPTSRRSRWPLYLITYLAGVLSALVILGA